MSVQTQALTNHHTHPDLVAKLFRFLSQLFQLTHCSCLTGTWDDNVLDLQSYDDIILTSHVLTCQSNIALVMHVIVKSLKMQSQMHQLPLAKSIPATLITCTDWSESSGKWRWAQRLFKTPPTAAKCHPYVHWPFRQIRRPTRLWCFAHLWFHMNALRVTKYTTNSNRVCEFTVIWLLETLDWWFWLLVQHLSY